MGVGVKAFSMALASIGIRSVMSRIRFFKKFPFLKFACREMDLRTLFLKQKGVAIGM